MDGLNRAVFRELNVILVLAEGFPIRQSSGVGISGFGEIRPVSLKKVGKLDINGAEVARKVAVFWEVSEDIGKFGGMDRKRLAGDGMVEFVFVNDVMSRGVPYGFGNSWAAKEPVG